MIMKTHSYMNINGYLSQVHEQAQAVLAQLKQATESVGGWDEAMRVAEIEKKRARRQERANGHAEPDERPTNDGPAPVPAPIVAMSVADHEKSTANGDATLRKRNLPASLALAASSSASSSTSSLAPASHSNPSQVITTGTQLLSPSMVLKPSPHPLVAHPSPEVSALAKEYSELDSELVGTGPQYIRWPNNLGLASFANYMITPTLVYELEYPRTERCVPFLLIFDIAAY